MCACTTSFHPPIGCAEHKQVGNFSRREWSVVAYPPRAALAGSFNSNTISFPSNCLLTKIQEPIISPHMLTQLTTGMSLADMDIPKPFKGALACLIALIHLVTSLFSFHTITDPWLLFHTGTGEEATTHTFIPVCLCHAGSKSHWSYTT